MIKFFFCLSLLSTLLVIGVRVSYAHSKQYKVEKQPTPKQYKKDEPDDYYKHKDQTAQTQVNQQTDLFGKSIENWGDFQEKIDAGKAVPCEAMEEDLSIFDKRGMAGARSEKDALATIKASEFDDKGSAKLSEFRESFGEGGDIYVDYERPLNKRYLEDAKEIAADQNELMGNLIGKLKELGVDCKTEKGSIEMEPAFFMQVKREDHKDAIYNQTMCEELRGTYNCTDTMSITCLKRNWKFYEWKDDERHIKIGGFEAKDHGFLFSIKWKKKRFGLHMHQDRKDGVRHWIGHKLGVHPDQIGGVRYTERGNEPIPHAGGKEYVFNDFDIYYKFRDGEEICDQWSEERWDESCTQKR